MTLPKPRDPVSWNQSATTNCTWSASLGAFRSAQEKTELARRCGRVVLSAQSCQRWPTMLASSPSPRHSDRGLRMCRRFWNRPSHIVQVWSTWPWKSFWCWDFVIQNGHDSVTQHYESKIAGVRIELDKEAPHPHGNFQKHRKRSRLSKTRQTAVKEVEPECINTNVTTSVKSSWKAQKHWGTWEGNITAWGLKIWGWTGFPFHLCHSLC